MRPSLFFGWDAAAKARPRSLFALTCTPLNKNTPLPNTHTHSAFGFAAVDAEEVADGDDGVVGAVVAQDEDEEEGGAAEGKQAAAAVLLTIAVRADRRRQGLGRALVAALAERARAKEGGRVVADVARDNAPARALLEAAGFSFGSGGGGGGGDGSNKQRGRRQKQQQQQQQDKSVEGVLEL